MTSEFPPPDILADGYSWAAKRLLDDPEYLGTYQEMLARFLESASVKREILKGTWYTNQWPACRVESEQPSVLVLGRATAGQWAERIAGSGFDARKAIDTAARKDMGWVDRKRRSQYISTAIRLVGSLPVELRNNPDEASLDITWSNLYKIARDVNPSRSEMSLQGNLRAGNLVEREVEVLAPRLIIALTQTYCRSQHAVTNGWFDDLVDRSRPDPKRPNSIARHAKIAGTHCVVLPHPQGGPKRERYVSETLQLIDSL